MAGIYWPLGSAMPFSELVEGVIAKDLCAMCGACEVACPEQIIRMVDLTPTLASPGADVKCLACSDCVEVCPGAEPRTAEVEEELFGRQRKKEELWLGIHGKVAACRATDEDVYAASASGGSVSALLAHALEHLGLDWVLVCGRDAQRPYRASPVLCRDPKSVHKYAQSTYQLSPYLVPLRTVLDAQEESPGAVVGLACHMQAIRGLQRLQSPIGERARQRIHFLIEIACSSNTLPSGTETLIAGDLQLALEDVADVLYRDGDPYPGAFTVVTRNGERHTLPLWRAVRHFKDHKTHRCLSCPDWLSGLADISVIDGDPNIFIASAQGGSEFQKTGTLLVRTARGAALLESAIAAGAIVAARTELLPDNLGLERKRSRRRYYESQKRPISAGPIPGHGDEDDVLDDETLLSITDRSHSLRGS
jgi:coenzyme F420 hydrogenase subunit beta